jgi:hypothetical protein
MCDETLVVQTAGWYQIQEIANTSNISNAIKMDTTISTTLIEADTPQMLNLDFSVEGNANFVIYDVGMCMRVVTGGTDGNIIVMTGTSVTSKPNSWDFNNLYWLVP